VKTGRANSWIYCLAAGLAIAVALSGQLAAQTAVAKSLVTSSVAARKWSVQVERIDPVEVELAHSFQVAIYENLLEELNKTKQFKYVIREGDDRAREIPDLLILKTMVVKYTPGSETKRAVTTIGGATKLMVRTQLITRDGKIVVERTVQGNVRFFGGNLRATHNLARNIAKMIKQSALPGSEQVAQYTPVNSDRRLETSPGF